MAKGLPFLTFLFLLLGCASHSLDDFYEEGQGIMLTLIEELRPINTREQLLSKAPTLKRLFNELTAVMIKAHEFRMAYPEANPFAWRDHILSDQLREELSRLYAIEGVRDIVEKCQEEALNRLDDATKRN